MTTIRVTLLAATATSAALLVGIGIGRRAPLHPTAAPPVAPGAFEHAVSPHQIWTCSMHPQVLQDHPGPCPICGMQLTPVAVGRSEEPGSGGAAG